MKKTEEREFAAAMRAGFTLIEILVAVAIIGILGTVATVSIPRILENNKIKAAKMGVDNLKAAVVTYNIEKGKYPSDLKALVDASGDDGPVVEGGDNALYDPWGVEYKYERKGKKIVVISAGPDGEFGGEDDIRSDTTQRAGGND
jgi:general secretion pathway protein G